MVAMAVARAREPIRYPTLPAGSADALAWLLREARHLDVVRAQHQHDRVSGAGWVEPPAALLRTHPNAGCEWVWQW